MPKMSSNCQRLLRSTLLKPTKLNLPANVCFQTPRLFTTTSSVNDAVAKKETSKDVKPFVESKSCVMNIFRGKLEVKEIFPFPNHVTKEQKEFLIAMLDPFEKFTVEVNDPAKNDEMSTVDPKTMQGMKEMGAFGIQVPEEYGGLQLTNTQYARLVEIVGKNDLGMAIVLGAHQSIGFKGILLFGNDKQKAKYLPTLATGEKLAAYCLTEPTSGSDAASIQTRATKSKCGTYYTMEGGKIWISNGGLADVFTVFAKTAVTKPDGTVKDEISAFIVERDFGGVTSGPPENKMGIKASNTAEVHFDGTKIPAENLIGKEGEGFKIAMEILNNGRFGMGAALSGTMKEMIKRAADHALNRTQFGSKIHEYGTIQEKIARMAMLQYVNESMAFIVCGNMDAGIKDFQLEAAISKVFASDAAWNVTDECLQILGGMGYMKETGVERFLRDVRIFRIFEGSNEILRLFVALTGIQYASKALDPVMRALNSPFTNLGTIASFGSSYVVKRIQRSLGMSGGPSLAEHAHPSLKASADLTSKAVFNFGLATEDLMMKYKKNIVHEQFLLNRVANSAIDIFTMIAVLSKTTSALNDPNIPDSEYEVNICNTWCSEASRRISDNLDALSNTQTNKNFDAMKSISQSVVKNGGVVQNHPLGF